VTHRIVGPLLEWFDARERDVPWRGQPDPYAILVAEVMAQQTRIETVAPYYRRFCHRFSDVHELAAAELDEVMRLWEGLGYYARARNLHAAARAIVERYDGLVPDRVEALLLLPGIGPYTAGAISSIAFGHPEPAIDGNARRVLARLFDIPKPTPSRLEETARLLLARSPDRSGDLNQAIMDLGRHLCIPRRPRCGDCPVVENCLARKRGTVADRPPMKPTREKPERVAAAALVALGDRLLVVQRPAAGLLGGLWDLPSVDLPAPQNGDSPVRQLESGLARDLGLSISIGEEVGEVHHTFSHFRLRLLVYRGAWRWSVPSSGCVWRWAWLAELEELAFPIYVRRLLRESATSGTS